MIDIHSHILYGIDDGSSSIDTSISIIKEMKERGVKAIVATPHFIYGTDYCTTPLKCQELLDTLKKELKKENIDIDIYLGNEVFTDEKIFDNIKENNISFINNSRYILIEFSFFNHNKNVKDIVFRLKSLGYIPIIAHPERYDYYINNQEEIFELLEEGALFQGNISCYYGGYGKNAKKLFDFMIERHLYSFLGTDVHSAHSSKIKELDTVYQDLEKIVGKEYTLDLLDNNAKRILNNELVKSNKIEVKKSFVSRFKKILNR